MIKIIDAVGPFFVGYSKKTINWSKIPFTHLEKDGVIDDAKWHIIEKEFKKFVKIIKNMGYTAITLDNMEHLANCSFYSKRIQVKITSYQRYFGKLITYAKNKGLQVFITTDIMYYNKDIVRFTKKRHKANCEFLQQATRTLFSTCTIDGLIIRIGENDGLDVQDDFLSELTIKTPKQAENYIRALQKVCIQYDKTLIVRTWTVGAYQIGDLMWNEKTFMKTFQNISTRNIIISMKPGDTDFYRNVPVNPLFFKLPHKKIVEIQTKMERELFGLLPYYAGKEYEYIYNALKKNNTIIGISVWCQTGGWSNTHTVTFLENSSMWNELNTKVCVDIFSGMKESRSMNLFLNNKSVEAFVKAYDAILQKLLYIHQEKPIYFRRVRIPPQIWIFWDHITINSFTVALYTYSKGQTVSITEEEITTLAKIAKKAAIYNKKFYLDAITLLVDCQRLLLGEKVMNINEKIRIFHETYPSTMHFSIRSTKASLTTNVLLKIMLRRNSKYRFIDKIFMTRIFSYIPRLAFSMYSNKYPKIANKQAMSVSTLFK